MVVGIGLLVLLRTQDMSDSLMASCLTCGIIALGVGIVITAMCITKALWHYVYKPTHSRMKACKCYLGSADYQLCLKALDTKDINALGSLTPITTANSALSLLYSKDHAIALLQAERYDSGHFEPETPVVSLYGDEVSRIMALCK